MTEPQVKRCGYAAILGRPNVGKSTLLNRLVGQKLAITSDKAQTTRHSILGIKTLEQGQIVFVDTPGLHQRADHAMNRYLNRTAKAVLQNVDVILLVVEACRWTAEDEGVLASVRKAGVPVILVINKLDRIKDKTDLLPYIAARSSELQYREVIPTSATSGQNIAALEQAVLQCLPRGDNLYPEDQVTDRSERFFAAELLREQLTRRYGKELPYALSVEIETFQEEGDLYRIGAVVWVERPGQKAILIGKEGAAMKETARLARLEMEALFERKVYLSVWVKVKTSWSTDESALARLGYRE
jgi:GTP-binding protein Era